MPVIAKSQENGIFFKIETALRYKTQILLSRTKLNRYLFKIQSIKNSNNTETYHFLSKFLTLEAKIRLSWIMSHIKVTLLLWKRIIANNLIAYELDLSISY
jgi:hypothetical protein